MKKAATGVLLLVAVSLAGCGSGSSGGSNAAASASTSSAPTSTSTSSSGSPTPNPSSTYTAPPTTLPLPVSGVAMSTGPAPWPAPVFYDNGARSAAYVEAAGLPYREEMLKIHYHAHLDVIVNGKPVPVPAYLGFVAKGNSATGLAPLHTHNADGIIHIENNVPATFLLGQVFVEWGVRLSPTCLGGYCADNGNELAVFVDGARYTGDPMRLVLKKHQEIAVEYGPTGTLSAPPAYKFPKGV